MRDKNIKKLILSCVPKRIKRIETNPWEVVPGEDWNKCINQIHKNINRLFNEK